METHVPAQILEHPGLMVLQLEEFLTLPPGLGEAEVN